MKKSKSLFAAILAVLSIGLVSCGNENNPSQPSNNPTTPSNNSQTPSVKNSYTFDVNGELKEGMTVTLIFKNNGSAIVEQASVVYSVDDASKATVSGNKITFTGNGSVKITATYKGETIEKTVEVAEGEHIYTIAEAKAATSDANNLIKMRGKVTASLGTSATSPIQLVELIFTTGHSITPIQLLLTSHSLSVKQLISLLLSSTLTKKIKMEIK